MSGLTFEMMLFISSRRLFSSLCLPAVSMIIRFLDDSKNFFPASATLTESLCFSSLYTSTPMRSARVFSCVTAPGRKVSAATTPTLKPFLL